MGLFRRLGRYMMPYKWLLALNVLSNLLMALFSVASIPALVPFLNLLFDRGAATVARPDRLLWNNSENLMQWVQYWLSELIAQNGREQALLYVCGGLVGIFFFRNLFRYLSLFFLTPALSGIVRDLRQQIFDKIMGLPLGYFSEERKGDLMSRSLSDVQEVERSILSMIEALFREPIMLIGALVGMVLLSPQLTLLVFVLLLFVALVIGNIGRTLKRGSAKVQSTMGLLMSVLEESLSGLRIIKGFGAEAYQSGKFAEVNNRYRHALTRLFWRKDLASPLSEFLGISVLAVLLWYGSKLVFDGSMTGETFLTFIFAFYSVINPAKALTAASYNVQKGMAAAERIDSVLQAPNPITEKADARPIDGLREGIEFRHVDFAYTPERPVLRDINLRIPQGQVVALVGMSGAGKSTLADLLPRFYDVSGGQILLDGSDLRDLKLADLRRLMGLVTQEAVLFNDSIFNNIAFGDSSATRADVERAARIANAHEFIMASERGYETNIGDRGSKLSGGQRQRLTIARAVLRDPPLLILDEATSALDSESERLVQEALQNVMRGRTSVLIAHRLSTIQHADLIVVMQEGRIVEMGRHDALLQQGGEYSKLVKLQAMG